MTGHPVTAAWPRTHAPSVGDTVELGVVRYRITALHMTDEGVLARLTPTGGSAFVMAHELRIGHDDIWRPGVPESEGEK